MSDVIGIFAVIAGVPLTLFIVGSLAENLKK